PPLFRMHQPFIHMMQRSGDRNSCGYAGGPQPFVGILASTDMLAADQASVDMVFAMKPEENHDLVERMTTRHGLRQLSYMKELGIGNDRYVLIDLDHDGRRMSVEEAVANLTPFAG
ncbi:MAG: hypothetical protein SOI43_02735, partial [Olsenella sp.]